MMITVFNFCLFNTILAFFIVCVGIVVCKVSVIGNVVLFYLCMFTGEGNKLTNRRRNISRAFILILKPEVPTLLLVSSS